MQSSKTPEEMEIEFGQQLRDLRLRRNCQSQKDQRQRRPPSRQQAARSGSLGAIAVKHERKIPAGNAIDACLIPPQHRACQLNNL